MKAVFHVCMIRYKCVTPAPVVYSVPCFTGCSNIAEYYIKNFFCEVADATHVNNHEMDAAHQ